MATEYGGYMGRILQIDLTTETAKEHPFMTAGGRKPWEERRWFTGSWQNG